MLTGLTTFVDAYGNGAIPRQDGSNRCGVGGRSRGRPVRWDTVPGLADVERTALSCTRCPLAAGRTTVVFGEGDPTPT